MNWIKRIGGTLAMILFLVTGPAIYVGQAQQPRSSPSPVSTPSVPAQKTMAGIWVGVVEVSGLKIRIILRILQDSGGALTARLDVPDQGASDLPIEVITVEGKLVHFEASKLGTYEGMLNNDASEIFGQLKQGPTALPVTFKRTDKAPTLGRPQDPQKPYPYIEEEVSYENKIDAVKLAGTLTLPQSKGPFPAVVLITGSGSQDRNETTFGHRPFLVLADHLTRLGIAVLRVDDRGMGGSSPGSPTATSENFAGDVLAGVEFLKNRKEVDPREIGLIGHSEGGMIAPMAAIRSKDVSYIVMMAGTGLPGDEVIQAQTRLLLKAQGAEDEGIRLTLDLFDAVFAILKKKGDSVATEREIRETLAAKTAAMTEVERKGLSQILTTIDTQLKQFYLFDWFRFFLRYDPRVTLRKVQIPVLALNGEKDLQTAPKENLDGIAAALKEGGNKGFSIVLLPQLNHLFQTSRTGMLTEYGEIEETISPIALKTISDWILKVTTRRITEKH
ncbi:MAG: alpha/beta hydrolase [Acidobacteriota bacterium]